MQTSPLQLNDFSIGKLSLVPAKSPFEIPSQLRVDAMPTFRRMDLDPRHWIIELNVTFKTGNDKTAAYEGSIEGIAHFIITDPSIDEERQRLLVAVNGPSIMYSSIRQVIASLTAQSTNGKMLLPSVSFADQRLATPRMRMPDRKEIDELLAQAHNSPDKIIAFQPTNEGVRLFANEKAIGQPGDDLAWAFAIDDLVKTGALTTLVPGSKWKLSDSIEESPS